jgi:feruloyl esterase
MTRLAFALTLLAAGPAAADTCSALTASQIALPAPAAVVSFSAASVTAGVITPPGKPPITGLPPFCRVSVVVSSSGDPATSQAAVEIWMPIDFWNGRYLGTGNGGFGGTIDYGMMQTALLKGFAAANTDLGTGILFGCTGEHCGDRSGLGGPPGGLYGDPAAIEDFGYQSTHLMTIAGKQMIAAYYRQNPAFSYFEGCSSGGAQALAESQRFPLDYDGILAGASGHNHTHLHMIATAVYEATHTTSNAYLTTAALALAHATILSHCAGKDGGLRTDDFLTQPASCSTAAASLQCTGAASETPCTDPAATTCSCLASSQVKALDTYWNGAQDSLGNQLYPGAERGAEEPNLPSQPPGQSGNNGLLWQEAQPEPVYDSLMFWAMGPSWKWQDLFKSTNHYAHEQARKISNIDATPVGTATFEAALNDESADLSAFAAHGGRMLMYHGYADPLIPSATSIDYYNAVATFDPAGVGNYLRLFMAPGVWHCGSGPGANVFGNGGTSPPKPLDPSDDVLGALMAWREQGQAPTQIIATQYAPDGSIAFQRPLCLYPAHSAYAGGDTTLASSFTCATGLAVTNQGFSPLYGP